MLLGWLVSPRSVSLTTTWKLPLLWLPTGSLALQCTVVVPMGKVLPEAGEQLMVSWPGWSSGSLALTAYVTMAPAGPLAFTVMVPGKLSVGAVVSRESSSADTWKPPATSTLPLGSRVAVGSSRATLMEPSSSRCPYRDRRVPPMPGGFDCYLHPRQPALCH